MSCFLSLQVRTGLNQVEQVSSRFETCGDVVKKMHPGGSVWGNRPVKAHVSCQDPSVDGEDVCDSACHHYSPFSTWSNEAWSSSLVPLAKALSSCPCSAIVMVTFARRYPFFFPPLTSDVGLSALAWWEVFRSISHHVGVTPGWN